MHYFETKARTLNEPPLKICSPATGKYCRKLDLSIKRVHNSVFLFCFSSSVGQGGYDLLVDVDAAQEDVLVEVLVVIVQQDRRAVHRGEAQRRDADAPQEAAVGGRREDFALDRQLPVPIANDAQCKCKFKWK